MTVILRKPRENEHSLLVIWRNQNREWFFNSQEIDLPGHLEWYAGVEKNPSQEFFVVDADGIAVGTIGLHLDSVGEGEYGQLVIGEDYQGQGLGKAAVRAILKYAFEELELDIVYGRIMLHNIRAIALDAKLGFKLTPVGSGNVVLATMSREEFEWENCGS